jgi:hypothetical protein
MAQRCPLISAPVLKMGQPNFVIASCIGQECSWWDTFRKQCAVVTILQLMPRKSENKEGKEDK